MMKAGDTIGFVCCSNGQPESEEATVDRLIKVLEKCGLQVQVSPYIYAGDSVFSATARQRAQALMDFYEDAKIAAIMDISGGDVANMVLPYLDYEVIKKNPKPFWGYSDLTTILNGIYTKTGNEGVLYQIKNVVWDESGEQEHRLLRLLELTARGNFMEADWMDAQGADASLFDVNYNFLRGKTMEGIVVGGNIRCFLKLAGTEYFPDLSGKLLLLEGLGGTVAQYGTYLAQLGQLRGFEKVSGILLVTFTQMEQEGCRPTVEEMLLELLREKKMADMPVAKTYEIGHGRDAKAMIIGKYYRL